MSFRATLAPAAILLALALAPPAARADEGACAPSIPRRSACSTIDSPGLGCGTFLVATDAWSGPFSRAEIYQDRPVAAPFAVQVTWQRLGSDGGESLSLLLRGGFLLLRRGEYGFYAFSESAFVWRPLPGFSTHRESTVRAEQRAREIVVWIDGRRAFTVPFEAPAAAGGVGLGMKGASGYPLRMVFRDFSVTPLDGQKGASAPAARPK